MKRGLNPNMPHPRDPLDAVIPPKDAPEALPATRKPKKPPAKPPTVKLSVRLPGDAHAMLERLAAFTPDSKTAIIAAGVEAELRRRVKRFEKEYGRPLPEMP